MCSNSSLFHSFYLYVDGFRNKCKFIYLHFENVACLETKQKQNKTDQTKQKEEEEEKPTIRNRNRIWFFEKYAAHTHLAIHEGERNRIELYSNWYFRHWVLCVCGPCVVLCCSSKVTFWYVIYIYMFPYMTQNTTRFVPLLLGRCYYWWYLSRYLEFYFLFLFEACYLRAIEQSNADFDA